MALLLRTNGIQEAGGSIPPSSTNFNWLQKPFLPLSTKLSTTPINTLTACPAIAFVQSVRRLFQNHVSAKMRVFLRHPQRGVSEKLLNHPLVHTGHRKAGSAVVPQIMKPGVFHPSEFTCLLEGVRYAVERIRFAAFLDEKLRTPPSAQQR